MTQPKFKYPTWFHKYPKWFRPAVLRASRLRLIGPLYGMSAESLYCHLVNDRRFSRLLDHCGGESIERRATAQGKEASREASRVKGRLLGPLAFLLN